MSLDEQFEQMHHFSQALESFNERLRISMTDLTDRHEAVSPIWQDSFRRTYDMEWNPFEEHMKMYLQREALAYSQFLETKLKYLQAYLFGG